MGTLVLVGYCAVALLLSAAAVYVRTRLAFKAVADRRRNAATQEQGEGPAPPQ